LIDIAAGGSHRLILKNDNTLWVTGNNRSGQLELGYTLNRKAPVLIMTDVRMW